MGPLPGDGGGNASFSPFVLPGGRLIEDEHRRPRRHGGGDGDEPLRLGRKVAWVNGFQIAQLDRGERFSRPLACLVA
jgi:hypothetical protein